ncbi:hypothetical protein TIFTF001_017699 [Ficus carica]|uniref:RNase H type-1 domain-containing protein n=1 Tax=Ficus carica TaxID=3494 RepID=A0AA88A5K2_FICCA|nr:hypothetical protein TIFTF001_017699 [Ficus carica]
MVFSSIRLGRNCLCTSVSWPQTSWYPPIHGCINVNVDDVVDHSKEHIGISVVACVEHGFVIAAATKRMIGRFSPHLDKCVAVREGVWLALVLGFSEWTVETDAINALEVVVFAMFPARGIV